MAEAEHALPRGEVIIRSITGDEGRLSLLAADNCAGIAALETLALLGNVGCGVALTLQKVSCSTRNAIAPWSASPCMKSLGSVRVALCMS